jgi:2-dehydropantoate 2-reductase
MRAAIIGIGGIGGYYGGKLAVKYAGAGEHEIIFIARGEHLKAIQQRGLRLIAVEGEFTAVPAEATDRPGDIKPFDLVLFCVKGYGLEAAAQQIKGNVHDRTVIIPLLNERHHPRRLRLYQCAHRKSRRRPTSRRCLPAYLRPGAGKR